MKKLRDLGVVLLASGALGLGGAAACRADGGSDEGTGSSTGSDGSGDGSSDDGSDDGGTGGTGGGTGGTGEDDGSTGGTTDSGTTDSGTTDGSDSSSSTGSGVARCEDLEPPDEAPSECSIEAVTEAPLEVNNDCEEMEIDVYWVDYGCDEVFYETITPGNNWSISSYETHPWRIRNANGGALLVDVPGLTGPTTVNVP